MPAGSILAEFRRRKIPQAAAIYVAVAWGVTEIVVTVVEQLFLPQWVSTLAVIGFVVGFPVAMFLAWTFDITSSGIQRTEVTSRRGKASIATSIVLLVAGTAGLFLLIRPSLEAGREGDVDILPNSLAVLPFESTSLDPNDGWLIEGLSDELRDQLARTPGLRIAARSSSVSARHQKLDAKTISELLGVANLVEGRFRRQGSSLRISIQLIEGKSGLTLWSEAFYGGPGELLNLQHAIVEQIVQFTLPGAADIAEPATRDVNANELMWLARHYEQQVRDRQIRNDETLREAVRLYREATQADPGSALAHSRLASALLYLGDLEAAEAPIFKALSLDPKLSAVQNTVGEWYWARGMPDAKTAWARAVELNPNNADALHNYAYSRFVDWYAGDHVDEIEALFRRALELDRLSLARHAALGDFLGQQGRDDRVRDVIEEIEELFDSAASYRVIARLKEMIGELNQAIAWTIRARDREPGNPDHVHKLADLYAAVGDFQTAEKLDPNPGPGVLLRMRRYAELIDQAQDLMLEDPSDVEIRFILATAYNATEQYDLALHILSSTGLPDSALENRVRSLSEINAFMTLFNALAGLGTDESLQ
ncbi:MAG: tetratricopeptide repeat protein, partial [Gammaproteobacteria bacterium]|nr:tetratricopeptide repeat protein [Gammaproteobacteria bacterium]